MAEHPSQQEVLIDPMCHPVDDDHFMLLKSVPETNAESGEEERARAGGLLDAGDDVRVAHRAGQRRGLRPEPDVGLVHHAGGGGHGHSWN